MRAIGTLGLLFATLAPAAGAQRRGDVSMSSMIARMMAVDSVLEGQSMEVVSIHMDIVGDSATTYRQLTSDWVYNVVAIADRGRVQNLNVVISKDVDGTWVPVANDTTYDEMALTSVRPNSAALYKFVVSVGQYMSGFSVTHYALIIYHR
jgi:hypothetical protein